MGPLPKIYHILCPSFHGSSVLCMLLNNHSRVRAIADANPLRGQNNCLCGQGFYDCDFWTRMREATDYDESEPYKSLIPSMPHFVAKEGTNAKINHILCHLAHKFGPKVWKLAGGKPARIFFEKYQHFVEGAAAYNDCEIIVDAEKHVLKTTCWQTMGGRLDGIIHLIRDPRPFARSGMLAHKRDDAAFYGRKWRHEHRMIEHYKKFLPAKKVLTLRYEDLVARPQDAMETLFDFLDVPAEDVFCPVKDPAKNHMYGNVAIQEFDGTIRPSEKWREYLSAEQQREIVRLTQPAFGRYGYSASSGNAKS